MERVWNCVCRWVDECVLGEIKYVYVSFCHPVAYLVSSYDVSPAALLTWECHWGRKLRLLEVV